MKRAFFLVPVVAALSIVAASADPATPAAPAAGTAAVTPAAAKTSCLNPSRSYVARPLNDHEVFAQQSIGKPKPPVRVKTSCFDLHAAISVGFSSPFTCIGLGDRVDASILGSGVRRCRVTGVVPYAPQEGDLHS